VPLWPQGSVWINGRPGLWKKLPGC